MRLESACLLFVQWTNAYILCVCDEKKYFLFTDRPTQVVKSFQVWKLAQCCCYVITWELLFFSIQTLCMHYYSASYVNKFLGGKTIRIIKSKQTFLNDCCAWFSASFNSSCQHELAHFQVFNLHPEMKKSPIRSWRNT